MVYQSSLSKPGAAASHAGTYISCYASHHASTPTAANIMSQAEMRSRLQRPLSSLITLLSKSTAPDFHPFQTCSHEPQLTLT